MESPQDVIEKKNEKSEIVAPAPLNPHEELMAIFNPPTSLSVESLEKCSFVEDRRWVGKRAAEIVEKKDGGFGQVTEEQLSQSHKQAWDERIMACKAVKVQKCKALAETESKEAEVTETPDPTKDTVEKAI